MKQRRIQKQHSPSSSHADDRVSLWIGIPIFCLLIVMVKIIYVISSVHSGVSEEAFVFAVTEIQVFFVVAFLICVAALGGHCLLQLLLLGLALLFVVLYGVDIAAIEAFDTSLNIGLLLKYLPEWRLGIHMLTPEHVFMMLLFVICAAVRASLRKAVVVRSSVLAALPIPFLFAGLFSNSALFNRYSLTPFASLLHESQESSRVLMYSDEEIEKYAGLWAGAKVSEIKPKTDVILVVVESLSASFSKRTSGLKDLVPGFDRISREGTLFRNFRANYPDSEGGVISILSGVAPIPYPLSNGDLFESFSFGKTVAHWFQENRYRTVYMTTAGLNFIDKPTYLKSAGFDELLDKHKVPAFRKGPTFAFHAPPDRVLYDEAVRRFRYYRRGDKPTFMVLVTVSSHNPMKDPLGRADTVENVFSYVGDELEQFHHRLKELNYYENGVLIVVGDHHAPVPVTQAERDLYGDSARSRVPLLVIGKGITEGRFDDRLFQQSDLFRNLNGIFDQTSQLSDKAIWVERYSSVFTDGSKRGEMLVFDSRINDKRAFQVSVLGRDVQWFADKPDSWREFERIIHVQRAYFQDARVNSDASCEKLYRDMRGTLPYVRQTKLAVPSSGRYYFRINSHGRACLYIDQKVVAHENSKRVYGASTGLITLEKGERQLRLEYFIEDPQREILVEWSPASDSSGEFKKIDLL